MHYNSQKLTFTKSYVIKTEILNHSWMSLTHHVMMYCMCSLRSVTLVCPPIGPPGVVLSVWEVRIYIWIQYHLLHSSASKFEQRSLNIRSLELKSQSACVILRSHNIYDGKNGKM